MQDIPLTNTNTNSSPIGPKTQMYVSGLLHRDDKLCVCIMLEEESKSIEIRMPEGEILCNKGYSDSQIQEITAYLSENLDDIMSTAKGINPMKAFMGK